ncbi:hypothetical protein [Aquamicrobium sp.]|uniref:hypothetical protein n=1 Tax=Aquamicrobium sp. TaxID=1872579 RepID=UPI002590C9B3|nr:hypothetical protein [Aquamicrobium sp.]MCK9549487.1 hypothetical protein [Aquamicrobium sp.]
MSRVLNYQGKLIDPLNLQESDFNNIGMQAAITLSRLQRFWGQCRESYTVAQHCLSMVEMFDDIELKKWAIGHEVYEALTGMDVPSPIKHSDAYLPYKNAEDKALLMFASIYGLTPPVPEAVKEADRALMVMEAEALMPWNIEVNWRSKSLPKGKLYKLGAGDDEIRRDFYAKWQELFEGE